MSKAYTLGSNSNINLTWISGSLQGMRFFMGEPDEEILDFPNKKPHFTDIDEDTSSEVDDDEIGDDVDGDEDDEEDLDKD